MIRRSFLAGLASLFAAPAVQSKAALLASVSPLAAAVPMTSVWLIIWGSDSVYGIYPPGEAP